MRWPRFLSASKDPANTCGMPLFHCALSHRQKRSRKETLLLLVFAAGPPATSRSACEMTLLPSALGA